MRAHHPLKRGRRTLGWCRLLLGETGDLGKVNIKSRDSDSSKLCACRARSEVEAEEKRENLTFTIAFNLPSL